MTSDEDELSEIKSVNKEPQDVQDAAEDLEGMESINARRKKPSFIDNAKQTEAELKERYYNPAKDRYEKYQEEQRAKRMAANERRMGQLNNELEVKRKEVEIKKREFESRKLDKEKQKYAERNRELQRESIRDNLHSLRTFGGLREAYTQPGGKFNSEPSGAERLILRHSSSPNMQANNHSVLANMMLSGNNGVGRNNIRNLSNHNLGKPSKLKRMLFGGR